MSATKPPVFDKNEILFLALCILMKLGESPKLKKQPRVLFKTVKHAILYANALNDDAASLKSVATEPECSTIQMVSSVLNVRFHTSPGSSPTLSRSFADEARRQINFTSAPT